MSGIELVRVLIALFALWIVLYSLISRVCMCIERHSIAKYVGNSTKIIEENESKNE